MFQVGVARLMGWFDPFNALFFYRALREIRNLQMSQFETMTALLDDIKTATDANAAAIAEQGLKIDAASMRLQEVIDALKAGQAMTAEELAALAAKAHAIKGDLANASTALNDEVAKLEATGVDPDNPTP